MQPPPRPSGITVLAILHFVIAALVFPSGALWIWVMGMLADPEIVAQAGMPANLNEQVALLLRLGKMAGWILIVFGLLKVVSGVGLWKLRNWGRRLTLGLAGLAVALSLPGLVSVVMARDPFSVFLQLLFAVGYGVIVWYLFRPEVKRAFGVS